MLNDSLFSSNKGDWETPQWLYNMFAKQFSLSLDVCASNKNHKCDTWFGEHVVDYDSDDQPIFEYTTDGLIESWADERCWMNPPYGRDIGKWVQKAHNEMINNNVLTIGLLPARTDTKWYHDHCDVSHTYIGFIKGRLKFVDPIEGKEPQSAPFPSMIVIWANEHNMRAQIEGLITNPFFSECKFKWHHGSWY